ncbi:MAG: hypothetical protein AAGG38_11075 [Planctomycetota bacterium]
MWRGGDTPERRCRCTATTRGGAPVSVRRARRGRAAVGLLLAAVAGGWGVSAGAQDGETGRVVVGLDESHGRSAHRLVERWVRAGGVPGERASAIRVSGVMGLRVTLRLDGRSLGEGTAIRSDLEAVVRDTDGLSGYALGAIDLVDLLEPAASEALGKAVQSVARRRLAARVRSASAADGGSTAGAVTPEELGPQLNVDLQIAYRPVRIVIGPEASRDTIYARFAPGYHGLFALPEGSGVGETMVWPGTAVAGNLSPSRQVLRLLTRAGLEPDQTDRLGRAEGVGVGRFEVLHMVRPREDQPVLRLVRGGVPVPGRFVDEATVEGMSDRIGLHLYGRFITGRRVRGPYRPSRGEYQPALAGDLESALAAYAMSRYARWKERDGELDGFYAGIHRRMRGVVDAVVGRVFAAEAEDGGATRGADAVTVSFGLLTVLESPAEAFDPAMGPRLAGWLLDRIDPDTGRLTLGDADEPGVPMANTAAVLAAVSAWYERTRDPAAGATLAAMFDAIWAEGGGEFEVNSLPWVIQAWTRAKGLLVDAGQIDEAVASARDDDLGRVPGLIAELQVVDRPTLGPADVLGGVVLLPGPEGSPPNPAWQTAQLLSFQATALRSPGIVSRSDRPGVLLTTAGAARFVAQLMIDAPSCFAAPSPSEAVGGVRLSLWDNTLEIAPSALSLLALLEMRETSEALRE